MFPLEPFKMNRQLKFFFLWSLKAEKAMKGGRILSGEVGPLRLQIQGIRDSSSLWDRSDMCILSVELTWPFFCVFLSCFPEWTWAVTRATFYLCNISAPNADNHCRHHEFLMWWWWEGCWCLLSLQWTAVTLVPFIVFILLGYSWCRLLFCFIRVPCSHAVIEGRYESEVLKQFHLSY